MTELLLMTLVTNFYGKQIETSGWLQHVCMSLTRMHTQLSLSPEVCVASKKVNCHLFIYIIFFVEGGLLLYLYYSKRIRHIDNMV